MTIVFPAPGTVVCGCDEDAACSYHAKGLTMRFCYCTNDTPCNRCVEEAHEEQSSPELIAQQESFLAATADFYIPGWTPEDEDAREHDRKILADMIEEAQSNPDMAHALNTLYGEEYLYRYQTGVSLNAERYTAADYLRDTKADAKSICPCNDCTNDNKWFNQ